MNRVALVVIAACGGNKIEAAERDDVPDRPDPVPVAKLAPVSHDALCVTKGAAAIGSAIEEPTMRAIARGSSGDAASLAFRFRGDTGATHELASGQRRRQLGLKLRAMNGCNLVYVMWRLDPRPKLEVSIKRNPGMKTHKECGASGYTKVKPTRSAPVPVLDPGTSHTLRAEITGDELVAWIDDGVAWRGDLPAAARALAGPAGIRSDNLAFELAGFEAPAGAPSTPLPKCVVEDGD